MRSGVGWNFSSSFNVVVPAAAVVVPVAAAADLAAVQEEVADSVAAREGVAERVVHPAVEAVAAVEAVGVDARKK